MALARMRATVRWELPDLVFGAAWWVGAGGVDSVMMNLVWQLSQRPLLPRLEASSWKDLPQFGQVVSIWVREFMAVIG